MTWVVVSPVAAATDKAIVVTIDVPLFIDEINYEKILGRAFSSPADRDRLASGLVIVLATHEGRDELRRIVESMIDVPVEETLTRLALRRQIVALRYQSTS